MANEWIHISQASLNAALAGITTCKTAMNNACGCVSTALSASMVSGAGGDLATPSGETLQELVRSCKTKLEAAAGEIAALDARIQEANAILNNEANGYSLGLNWASGLAKLLKQKGLSGGLGVTGNLITYIDNLINYLEHAESLDLQGHLVQHFDMIGDMTAAVLSVLGFPVPAYLMSNLGEGYGDMVSDVNLVQDGMMQYADADKYSGWQAAGGQLGSLIAGTIVTVTDTFGQLLHVNLATDSTVEQIVDAGGFFGANPGEIFGYFQHVGTSTYEQASDAVGYFVENPGDFLDCMGYVVSDVYNGVGEFLGGLLGG